MALKIVFYVLTVTLFFACSFNREPPFTIAINPWPGYEFLYLAEKKQYFKQVGLNLKLLQMGSLSDARRAYVNGKADGLASTVIEAVQAQVESNRPLKIVLVPDYSNGGDVVIARRPIQQLQQLKGRAVGCEVDSLGIYLLHRALSHSGLSLADIKVVNVAQAHGEQAMLRGEIDAFVSYPPISVGLLKHDNFHTIFTSAAIPNEIIDTVSISEAALRRDPKFIAKLHRAWQMAIDEYTRNPQQAVEIMAAREHITAEEFTATLADLKILDREDQKTIFAQPDTLRKATVEVCEALVQVEAIQTNCNFFPNIVSQLKL